MCEKFKLLIAQIKLQPTGFVFDAAVGCNQQDHIQPLAGGDYLHLGDDGKLRCCIGHYRCALGQLRKGCACALDQQLLGQSTLRLQHIVQPLPLLFGKRLGGHQLVDVEPIAVEGGDPAGGGVGLFQQS